ncbi:MAG: bifunctional phosphopantothenoylcysteine decarboxylase/phosphopantothenate--cysteine ligase CoaBC [Betaproteobacteria bacterium]|nr:bifunctional phosphopantothenoylcysteine decarboxylase/phosphopantothenate--cysteine ligase CoaBC [Betaproteobacteria bacterium]
MTPSIASASASVSTSASTSASENPATTPAVAPASSAGLPPDPLAHKRLVLGITGGIAAYKSVELARLLSKALVASIQTVMTEAATRFVGTATFQAVTGRPVFTDAWDTRIANGMAHIDLSREADGILIAPASADFLALLAQGRAPDLLSTLCLARDCPLAVAPAMNRQMWEHPATQRNLAQLRADGIAIFGPGTGEQACGEVGDGRMLEPAELIDDLRAWFAPKLLAGKRAIVSAGPTFEAIDPVRGITNRSSGKMGYAVARALAEAGAEVVLVSGPTALPAPRGVQRIEIESALQMRDAVHASLPADLFVAVAAVADWRPAVISTQKIRKAAGAVAPELRFVENPDILAEVAALPNAPYCVGFAAETDDTQADRRDLQNQALAELASAKRLRKRVPLLVANIGPDTFGRDDNALLLVDESGSVALPRAPKDALSRALVAEIAGRLDHQHS